MVYIQNFDRALWEQQHEWVSQRPQLRKVLFEDIIGVFQKNFINDETYLLDD